MPRRIALTVLDASTADIINTIRKNASLEYQQLVPTVTDIESLHKVGDVLYGYPALANQFLNSLFNRVALTRINSMIFNNAYSELKKGFLEFGEVVEEVFVNLCKAREFSAEKAESREFKRTLPDVRAAFHCINYRAQYPITIENDMLRAAFTSFSGVEDMIAKIINSVTVSAEYDEFLLFKYLIIKAVTHGKMYPVKVGATLADSAEQFRGVSNALTFPSTKYNQSGVHNVTAKDDQYIFMDAFFNAKYDVNVLASAFNMDKATFSGHLKLIDNWTEFDNDRFAEIVENTDTMEAVTDDELAIMAKVQAVLVDSEWFQFYDNLAQMSEQYVASGLYWNYFYNAWKTISSSPFSNAVVFVTSDATTTLPSTIEVTVESKSASGGIVTINLATPDSLALIGNALAYIQTEDATSKGIGVQRYGSYMLLDNTKSTACKAAIGSATYTGDTNISASLEVGDTITLTLDT